MPFTRENPLALLVDDHHGQYVGQVFAEIAVRSCWPTITAEDWAILEAGPDHEDYAETCHEIDGAEGADKAEGATLVWQDGALWAIDFSLIGDPDDLHDIADDVENRIRDGIGTWDLYCDLRASLYDGPDFGRWNEELLSQFRDAVEYICEDIAAELPVYWHTDFGITEERIDVMAIARRDLPGVREILSYV